MIRHMQFISDIIPVKSDIKLSVMNGLRRKKVGQFFYNLVRQKNPTWLNAYQNSIGKVYMILQDLVTESFDGNSQLLFVQYCFQKKYFYKNSSISRLLKQKSTGQNRWILY